jgi:replicative DNA helicase
LTERSACILTQEMPDEEIGDRAIANLGRVDYTAIQTGKFSDDDWGRLTDGVEIAAQLPIWIDDQAGLTLGDIRGKARSIKGLQVLVLDYLQLCSGSTGRKDANRNSQIEEISRGLKTLAKELGIAIVMLSQLNREVEKRADKRPHLADLRDSGSIEQDADAVVFLWPVRDFESQGHRLIGCAVEANRSGPCGEFGLDTEGRHQRWVESDQDIGREAHSPLARADKGFKG